jgi:hypothetical protein
MAVTGGMIAPMRALEGLYLMDISRDGSKVLAWKSGLTVPEGKWEKMGGMERIDTRALDSFVSLTADGQPAIMSHTGVAQIYALHWKSKD